MKKLIFLSVLFLSVSALSTVNAQSACQPNPQCQAVCAAKKASSASTGANAEVKTVAVAAAPTSNAVMEVKSCNAKAGEGAASTVQAVNFLNPATTALKNCNPADCDPSKCDPSKCDLSKCDPSKCKSANGAAKKADSSL